MNVNILNNLLFLGKSDMLVFRLNAACSRYNRIIRLRYNIPLLYIFYQAFPLIRIILLCCYVVLFLRWRFLFEFDLGSKALKKFELCP